MFTICDSLGIYLFAPTKDLFQVVNSNCLIHKTANGYMFTDANGKPVSGTYDSVFAIPDFNYIKMVLGDKGSRIGFGSDVQSIGPLDRDGFSPVVITPMTGFYGIVRGGKMGLFKAEGHSEIFPQYLLVARVNEKLFVARKDNQWLTINDNGDLKPHRKSKYINFFENYILIGN